MANSSGGISQTNSGSMAGGMQAAIGNNNVMNNEGTSSLRGNSHENGKPPCLVMI